MSRSRRPLRALRARATGTDGSLAGLAGGILQRIAGGRLAGLPVTLRFWDGSQLPAADGAADGNGRPAPVVSITSPRALAHVVREPGELGLARGWVDGSLDTDDDLEHLLWLRGRLAGARLSPTEWLRVAATALLAAGPALLRRPPIPATETVPPGRLHSLRRDRAAISHHYDVSNDFYRRLLGPSLVYSCAYFADADESLEEAQERKLELICRKLALSAGESLLDIGCGWGSLVLHAAARHGVRATGVTLSAEQAALARRRVHDAGLEDRVEILVADYRELTGRRFDKIASVGMYEHVGEAQLPRYALAGHDLLAPGGLMLNHGIARLDERESNPRSFTIRYVFPDGELPRLATLIAALQGAGLEVRDVESLREHYPLTLRRWGANLHAERTAIETLVGTERARVWDLYMAGAAAEFSRGAITVFQVLVTRGDAPHRLPLLRERWLADPADQATVD